MSDEIIYLDPMDIELDEYNLRRDSPVDSEKIELIKQDLYSGRGIQYPITCRFKDDKYFCFIGRNRLIAAKEYVKETGNRVKMPVKVEGVDDMNALRLSFEENFKREELSEADKVNYVKRMYKIWMEKICKKYGYLFHGEMSVLKSAIGITSDNNPLAIPKFIEECDIPYSVPQVMRFLRLGELPREFLDAVDDGYIDELTAYDLTKFGDDERLRLLQVFKELPHIPRDLRISALNRYRDQGGDFWQVLIDGYKQHLLAKYGSLKGLDDEVIDHIAKRYDARTVSKICEYLKTIEGYGLKVAELDLKPNEVDRMATGRVDILRLIERKEEAKRRTIEMRDEIEMKVKQIMFFLEFDVDDVLKCIRDCLDEGIYNEAYIKKKILKRAYDLLVRSPGYAPKVVRERRRVEFGHLYKLYSKRYIDANLLISDGFKSGIKDKVTEGLKSVSALITEIRDDLLDVSFQQDILAIFSDIHDRLVPKVKDIADLERYMKFLKIFDEVLVAYIQIRRYLMDVRRDRSLALAMAEEIQRLSWLYGGVIQHLHRAGDLRALLSSMSELRQNMMNDEYYIKIRRFYSLAEEIEGALNDLDLVTADRYKDVYSDLKGRYEESLNAVDIEALEDIRHDIETVVDEINRLSEPKIITVYDGGRAIDILLRRRGISSYEPKVLENEVEELVEKYGSINGKGIKVKLRKMISYDVESVEHLSQYDVQGLTEGESEEMEEDMEVRTGVFEHRSKHKLGEWFNNYLLAGARHKAICKSLILRKNGLSAEFKGYDFLPDEFKLEIYPIFEGDMEVGSVVRCEPKLERTVILWEEEMVRADRDRAFTPDEKRDKEAKYREAEINLGGLEEGERMKNMIWRLKIPPTQFISFGNRLRTYSKGYRAVFRILLSNMGEVDEGRLRAEMHTMGFSYKVIDEILREMRESCTDLIEVVSE